MRSVLFTALFLCASPLGAKPVQLGPQVVFDLERLAEGVYAAVVRRPAPPAVSNSAFVVLEDGVLVVDSHLKPAAAKALLREIAKVTDKPVRYLVQTHHHGDHVGGNPAFPGAADIIAHERTRARLEAWNPMKARLPNAVIRDGITFHRGREVRVFFTGKGHTDGDLVVWLPADRILIAGDLLFHGGNIGFMKDAFIADWIETMDALAALAPATVVPGHGPLAEAGDLRAFKAYLIAFRQSVREHRDRGDSLDRTLETYRLPKTYRDWGMQDKALRDNVRRVWAELKRGS
jgi:cyclase